MSTKKQLDVVLIGSGAVGASFIYSAMIQNLQANFGIIDVNEKIRDGNVLDFEDAQWETPRDFNVTACDYKDIKDAKYLVITAGRPQKPGETRLQLMADNAKIMANIGRSVKESGFSGIAIIVSNPLDVMTYTFWKTSGLPKHRVIGTGTLLDTSRLRHYVAQRTGVSPKSVQGFILGEHGDSSLVAFSQIKVESIPLTHPKLAKIHKITDKNYEKLLEEPVRRKAYEIINRKGATYYGIGNSTAGLLRAIIDDSHLILPVSTYLNGEYGAKDVFIGVPAVITRDGVKMVLELDLNATEKKKFAQSVKIVKGYNEQATAAIK